MVLALQVLIPRQQDDHTLQETSSCNCSARVCQQNASRCPVFESSLIAGSPVNEESFRGGASAFFGFRKHVPWEDCRDPRKENSPLYRTPQETANPAEAPSAVRRAPQLRRQWSPPISGPQKHLFQASFRTPFTARTDL